MEQIELLKGIIKALAEPKEFDIKLVTITELLTDGVALTAMNSADRLNLGAGKGKTRFERNTEAVGAWFGQITTGGWKYGGIFEYEGLPNRGLIVLYKDKPNVKLLELIDKLDGKTLTPTEKLEELQKKQADIVTVEELEKNFGTSKEELEENIADIKLFEATTGKNAIWQGRKTKAYIDWKKLQGK